ncbi:D-glycero-beta-D-manno-heptose-7-phosphate kinase [Aromatoleum sp.]|uniref:D-glycero-beta-D-manno-heptose-7-phosphate kinase n=1 Tax=Aromatoleum sp. TaxID=2307007 RepID=UPI002FCA9692
MPPTLPDFSNGRVLVVGDVMLDRYWHGSTTRISPEAPVPVVKVEADEFRAGGAGNVALNVASLGANAELVGLVGRDEAARLLHERLEGGGVVCRLLEAPQHPTITKLRVISRHQQLIRLDFEDNFAMLESAGVEEAFRNAVSGSGAIVLSDYGKGTLAEVGTLIRVAREHRVAVVVDPKGTDFGRYAGATVITPNLSEFEAVVGHCVDESALVSRGEALREMLDLEALLVTRSERGMTLLQKGAEPLNLPTQARDVFDVTGAGDTVVAVLGAGLACGLSLPDATAFANLAAGVVVGKLGTATVNLAELDLALHAASAVRPAEPRA